LPFGEWDQRFLRIRHELGFWNRTTKIILGVVILLCVVGVVFGDYGALRIVQLRQQRVRLEADITEARIRHRLLLERKEKLESDPFTQEKLARERAGMARPGEIVFVFEEPDSIDKTDLDRIPLDKYSLNR
jgi:cell division protein FtsB